MTEKDVPCARASRESWYEELLDVGDALWDALPELPSSSEPLSLSSALVGSSLDPSDSSVAPT